MIATLGKGNKTDAYALLEPFVDEVTSWIETK